MTNDTSASRQAARIVAAVPRLFHRLRAYGEALHADNGLTMAMRGALLNLCDAPGQTVPALASQRPVSRQHMQTTIDALLARGLVAARANPAHKRSPLYEATEAGRALAATMRAQEARNLAELASGYQAQDLKIAADVLERLAEDFATFTPRPGPDGGR